MIREIQLDRFAMAFALSNQFCESFAKDRLQAIKDYNENYACRYGEKPIELNEDEINLVSNLQGITPDDIFQALVYALDRDYSLWRAERQMNISTSNSSAA